MVKDELEGMSKETVVTYIKVHLLEKPGHSMRKFSYNCRPPGRNPNVGPSEYDARDLGTI
jgi:hypothetical protein